MKKRKYTPPVKRRKRKSAPTMTRRRRSKKRGLSELFTPATATAAAKVIGSAAVGGLIAGAANKVLAKQNMLTRYGIQFAGSFLTYSVVGMPNMAAGMAGAFAALESQGFVNKLLAEEFADENAINELPDMMNENGEPLTLAQDENGNVVYLNEATGEVTLAEEVYLQDDMQTYLQDNMQTYLQDGIYPVYATQYQ